MAPKKRGVSRSPIKRGASRSRSRTPARTKASSKFDASCIATIRVFSAEQPTAAKSGHPGAPMGCAPMAHALWGHVMQFAPDDPRWPNRDRFVLSNGHASALQYTMLHLTGYDLPLKEIESFRKLHSRAPGHPECFMTAGVEVCTGPLGQGICNAIGFAIARAHMAATYDRPNFKLFDHAVYAICGDGCLMEGMTSEACSLAGELALPNLVLLYDDNNISIDGSTDITFTEDVAGRFRSYRWDVSILPDGDNDFAALLTAIQRARVCDWPAFLKIKTTIGFGCNKAGTAHIHGAPLSADDMQDMRKAAHFPEDKAFHVPKQVGSYYLSRGSEGNTMMSSWRRLLQKYAIAHPALNRELSRRLHGKLPDGWACFSSSVISSAIEAGDACLCSLMMAIPELIGGSIEDAPPLGTSCYEAPSTYNNLDRTGRHLNFGTGREHAAAACCVGIAAYGLGLVPFWRCPSSLLFNAWGAIRLSALSRLRVIHIATHDGGAVPAMLAMCRATPNLVLARPADAAEVAGAYTAAISHSSRPTVVLLPPPGTPSLLGSSPEAAVRGGYVLHDAANDSPPAVILIGSGPEVSICLDVQKLLADDARERALVRVVSIMSWELFEEQSEDYKQNILGLCTPSPLALYVGETGSDSAPLGFEKFARYCIRPDCEFKRMQDLHGSSITAPENDVTIARAIATRVKILLAASAARS